MSIETSKQTRDVTPGTVDVRRERPGKRTFGENVGPLQFIMQLKIPGYRLYLATDKKGRDPYRIQKLLDPTVGYAFVSPQEVGLTEIMGKPIVDDKVSIDVGGGSIGYLLKQPEEWAEMDRIKKRELSTQGIYLDSAVEALASSEKAILGGKAFMDRVK